MMELVNDHDIEMRRIDRLQSGSVEALISQCHQPHSTVSPERTRHTDAVTGARRTPDSVAA